MPVYLPKCTWLSSVALSFIQFDADLRRIYKERALKAEETLRKADQSIKALGIDLEKDDREKEDLNWWTSHKPPAICSRSLVKFFLLFP
eukprot:g19670.t1